MAKILITGSADGLGLLAAERLVSMGHEVVLHARNKQRAAQVMDRVAGASRVLVADLSSIAQTKRLAQEANAMGRFDVVVHNAGVYQVPASSRSEEGFPLLLAVNTLAPYVLSSLMERPNRLVYMSSGMHLSGDAGLKGLRSAVPSASYADTKLHDLILAKAVARKWPEVVSNAVDPGWVPTRMGGRGAPDDLALGFATQVWLAVSEEERAKKSGRYLHHQREGRSLPGSDDTGVQEMFLERCAELTGVAFPEG